MGDIFNGQALRDLRKKAGVSQSDLAEFMGYFAKGVPNRSMISALERRTDALNPRHEKLARLYLEQGRDSGTDANNIQ